VEAAEAEVLPVEVEVVAAMEVVAAHPDPVHPRLIRRQVVGRPTATVTLEGNGAMVQVGLEVVLGILPSPAAVALQPVQVAAAVARAAMVMVAMSRRRPRQAVLSLTVQRASRSQTTVACTTPFGVRT
jgi:hypothetical protein